MKDYEFYKINYLIECGKYGGKAKEFEICLDYQLSKEISLLQDQGAYIVSVELWRD